MTPQTSLALFALASALLGCGLLFVASGTNNYSRTIGLAVALPSAVAVAVLAPMVLACSQS